MGSQETSHLVMASAAWCLVKRSFEWVFIIPGEVVASWKFAPGEGGDGTTLQMTGKIVRERIS
jgi:hypothetical protein